MWEERWQPMAVAVWLECYFNIKMNLEECRDLAVIEALASRPEWRPLEHKR